MAEKKVGITAEVKIEGGGAAQEIKSLRSDLELWRQEWGNLQASIGLVLRSIAGLSVQVKASGTETAKTVGETKGLVKATSDVAKESGKANVQAKNLGKETARGRVETQGVANAVKQAATSTGQASKESKHFADNMAKAAKSSKDVKPGGGGAAAGGGGMGALSLGAVGGAAGALAVAGGGGVMGMFVGGYKALAGGLTDATRKASELQEVLEVMAIRGGGEVEHLRADVSELAIELGRPILEVAKTIDMAEQLGAGAYKINVARAAWQNYNITGMDANRTIDVSSRMIKGFNMDVSEQAEVILKVSDAAQTAKVSQEMLWNGMSSMAPMFEQLGGDFDDLLKITVAGINAGIKAEEEGVKGMQDLLRNLAQPTEEFMQDLIRSRVLITDSGDAWVSLTDKIRDQTEALKEVNAELDANSLKQKAIDVQVARGESDLEKLQSGDLSRSESSDLRRNMRGQVKDAKREGMRFEGRDVEDQFGQMLEARKRQAEELELQSMEMELQQAQLSSQLAEGESRLEALLAAVTVEIPAAMAKVIGPDGDISKLVVEMGKAPESMRRLSVEVQTMVAKVTPQLQAMGDTEVFSGQKIRMQTNQYEQEAVAGIRKAEVAIDAALTNVAIVASENADLMGQLMTDALVTPNEQGLTYIDILSDATEKMATKGEEKIREHLGDGKVKGALEEGVTGLFELVKPMVIEGATALGKLIGSSIVAGIKSEFSGVSLSDFAKELLPSASHIANAFGYTGLGKGLGAAAASTQMSGGLGAGPAFSQGGNGVGAGADPYALFRGTDTLSNGRGLDSRAGTQIVQNIHSNQPVEAVGAEVVKQMKQAQRTGR